ncbi:MAG: hypothetical protein LBM01_00010 [Christensenellaceae bacterium]|nr:hypothetical protein [Christensenellaceae bacterium]
MILAALFLILTACFLTLYFKKPNFGLSSLNLKSNIKESIIKLEKITDKSERVFAILGNEVKIFNKMNFVMPSRRGVPELYRDWLSYFLVCGKIPLGVSGYDKLFMAYAEYVLYNRSFDEIERKRILKNLVFILSKNVLIKKKLAAEKVVAQKFFLYKQVRYKFFSGECFDILSAPFEVEAAEAYPSYIRYGLKEGECKFSVDKKSGVREFEFDLKKSARLKFEIGNDKYEYKITKTSGSVLCVNERTKRATQIVAAYGKVCFTHNLLSEKSELLINCLAAGEVKIFVIEGETRAEVQRKFKDLSNANFKINALLSEAEIEVQADVEPLLMCAKTAQNIAGKFMPKHYETARNAYLGLKMASLVFESTQIGDIEAIFWRFEIFKKVGRALNGLNIFVLYSSKNNYLVSAIKNFLSAREIKNLNADKVFLYFLDRVSVDNKIVHYFHCLKEKVM